ncbi:MAG: TadE/TadG family type IV pilus assembly protein [Tsuneonella sp.]
MSIFRAILSRVLRDRSGTMAIETAIVAPVLATLCLGAFETSRIVSRQEQLQSAASEASQIILAAVNGPGVSSSDLETIIENSLDLAANQVAIADRYRCDTSATLVTTMPAPPTCAASKPISSYVQLTITDTYTPVWTQFGIGGPINYRIVRMVQVS